MRLRLSNEKNERAIPGNLNIKKFKFILKTTHQKMVEKTVWALTDESVVLKRELEFQSIDFKDCLKCTIYNLSHLW
jgi:hypothetical protein